MKEIAKISIKNFGNTLKCATSKNTHHFQDHSIFIAQVLWFYTVSFLTVSVDQETPLDHG